MHGIIARFEDLFFLAELALSLLLDLERFRASDDPVRAHHHTRLVSVVLDALRDELVRDVHGMLHRLGNVKTKGTAIVALGQRLRALDRLLAD